MSKMLFEKFTVSLRDELVKQLTAATVLVLPEFDSFADVLEYLEYNEMSSRDIAIVRQYLDIGKKFIGRAGTQNGKKASKGRDLACWEKFISANKRCLYQNASFGLLDSDIMATLERARDDIYKSFWGCAEQEDFPFLWHQDYTLVPVDGFSTGPGSCTGVSGVSTLEKYRNEWDVTSEPIVN